MLSADRPPGIAAGNARKGTAHGEAVEKKRRMVTKKDRHWFGTQRVTETGGEEAGEKRKIKGENDETGRSGVAEVAPGWGGGERACGERKHVAQTERGKVASQRCSTGKGTKW